MVNNWQGDKRWSDRFLPEIKSIIGAHLIGEPPMEEDAERNTDLMVLKMDAVRIACRVRRPGYRAAYGNEFTIRSSRPSGAKTELGKVIEGWGDYILYGFSDAQERSLAGWLLGDLKIFRAWYARELAGLPPGSYPGTQKENHDRSSKFYVFSTDQLPRDFLIARKPLSLDAAA